MRVQLTILFLFIYCFTFSQRNLKFGFIGVLDNKHNVFHGVSIDPVVTFPDEISVNGLSVGGILWASLNTLNGFGVSGLYSKVETFNGIYCSFGFSWIDSGNGVSLNFVGGSENMKGLNIGLLGAGARDLSGVSICGLLHAGEKSVGLTIAPINAIKNKVTGFQIGLFNRTNNAFGIQFGLINFIKDNPAWCRVLPIINMRFKK